MGAIQNSIDQAVGAVAGAAIGVKHIKESEKSSTLQAESQAIVAQGQAETATKEANKAYYEAKEPGGLISKLSEAEVNLGEAQKAYNRARNPVSKLEKFSKVMAAEAAFESLENEYKSVEGMLDRAEVMRQHAVKMTGIAEEKSAAYKRR